MNDLYNKLIELFARYKADDVHNRPEYQKLENKYGEEPNFKNFSGRIEKLKRKIENQIGTQDHPKDQIRESLLFLNRSENKEINDYLEIIRQAYYGNWSRRQQEFFDKELKTIGSRIDFFLSFTNRNSTPEFENSINTDHRNLIMDIIGKEQYEREDKSHKNLLAFALNKHLNDKSKFGFYYPLHEQNNQRVKDKLEDACERAFCFVQLVQGVMLTPKRQNGYTDNINYCYYEYELFTKTYKGEQKIYICAQPRDEIEQIKTSVPPDYDEWLQEILDRDVIHIPSTRNHDPDVIDKILQSFKDKLIDKLSDIKKGYYSSVPD